MAPRTAVYRDNLGCTLAIEVEEDELRAQAELFEARPDRSAQPWPVGDVVDETPAPGVDYGVLDAAIDAAFAEPDPDKLALTRAVVVIYGDQLIAERYAEGVTKDSPLLGWSMTKSVGATLVGILQGEGKLDVKAPAPVPAWQGDERAAITLENLLHMSSGLEFAEVYGPLSDATTMLFESHDAASVAIDKPLIAEPGTLWSYSSGTSNIISWIARQAVEAEGGWEAYATLPRRALFDPVGMRTAIYEPDPSGTFMGSSFMYASARDWARFGLLYLHDGVWQGERVLPEGWVEYAATPAPAAPMREYGAQIWLNQGKPEDPSERRFPSAPRDVIQASGFQGQAVVIVPSRDAVIVRLGMTHDRSAFDLDAFIASVLAALPEPEPAAQDHASAEPAPADAEPAQPASAG
nr:serine hydrolase [Pseudenhygromyxa sp. WMMC2535]